MQLQTYTKPSEIVFDVKEAEVEALTVRDVGRGVTFLYRGAVCMKVEVSGYQSVKSLKECEGVQDALKAAPFIINLQTGRVFVPNPNEPIQFVKVRMTVDGKR